MAPTMSRFFFITTLSLHVQSADLNTQSECLDAANSQARPNILFIPECASYML